jgi:GH24 family phage-related lysozyme (muramidase)
MNLKSQKGKIKTEDLDDDLFDDETPYEEVPTKLESGLRGAAQGLTLGFPDEIEAAGSSVLDDLKRLLSGQVDENPVTFDEQGIPVIPEESGQGYRENLERVRKEYSDAEKANPGTYLAGELAGGIIPGLASGGAAVAGGALKTGAKEAAKQIAKRSAAESVKSAAKAVIPSAKLGLKYGGASGAGYSEAENPLDLAKDTVSGAAAGGVLGAGLPLAGKGIMEAGKVSSKAVKGGSNWFFDLIPKSEQIKTAYNWGKLGKKLDIDVVDKEMMKRAGELAEGIGIKKDNYNIEEVMKKADDMGIRIDSTEVLEDAIESIKLMEKGDWFNLQNKDFLPNLLELVGTTKQSVKMNKAAQKKALKKLIESKSKADQAIIKGEKALAKEQIKSGDSLETITDINRPMNDLDLPLDTQNGVIGGVKGKFKNADGTERVVSNLDDITPFDPRISSQTGPDGRPIVMTKDLGSGKVEALVGEAEDMLRVDPSNFTISELDDIVKKINKATKLASGQGSADDPIVLRARKLAVDLRAQADQAAEASGVPELVERRAVHSDLFAGEDKLGISKVKGVRKDVYDEDIVEQIADKLSYDRGFKDRRDIERAGRYLGDDVMTPELEESFKMLRKVNEIMGRGEGTENISRAGLYEMASTGVSNTLGRGANKVSSAASKVMSPVTKTTEAITKMSNEKLNQVANNMIASGSEGTARLGNSLMEAINMKGQGKNAAIWTLSQNPAFRSLMSRNYDVVESNFRDSIGVEKEIDDSFFEDVPYDDETNEQMMYAEDDTSEEEEVKDVGRSPNSVEKIKQREGYAAKLGNEFTKYTGLEGTPNTRVEGSNSDYGLYYDSKGKLTSGIGDLVESEDQVESLKNQTKESAEAKLQENIKLKNKLGHADLRKSGVDVDKLPAHVLDALENANFQLGSMAEFPTLKKRLIEGLKSGDYNKAAIEAFTTKGTGTKASDWVKQTPVRVRDFVEAIADDPKVFEEFNKLNTIDKFDFSPEEIEQKEKEAQEVEREVDRVNQQQSSGDMSPISQLDSLLEKINNMSIAQSDKDTLEDQAIAMEGHSDGNRLKEMIRKLNGLS